jgi:hypothetical protein
MERTPQLRLLHLGGTLRQRYGRKGERVDPDQLLLFAREMLRERVRAGIAQARKEGRPHGGPVQAGSREGR